jgi:hypothetical protein
MFEKTVGPEWLALRKEPAIGSFDREWTEQIPFILKTRGEYIPSAAKVCWALITYQKVRGERLLQNAAVRTSSIDGVGDQVYVGFFERMGLHIDSARDDRRSSNLGVAIGQKLNKT